jgi:protein-tyrosine phosphatase
MAEALLRNALRGQDGITVASAGIGALVGHPAADFAVELMAERGIDIGPHRAQQLTPDLVSKADLILVMESGHRRVIDENEVTARGKVFRLGEWQDKEIDDPYRQDKTAFSEALADIENGIASWVEKLQA